MKRIILLFLSLSLLLTACQSTAASATADPAFSLPSEVATLTHPAQSPSGRYKLLVVDAERDGSKVLSFQVQSADGQLQFSAPDQFPTRQKTYFLWDSTDRVWVYAGDAGVFYWQNQDGTWKKVQAAITDADAPSFLRQAVPQQH